MSAVPDVARLDVGGEPGRNHARLHTDVVALGIQLDEFPGGRITRLSLTSYDRDGSGTVAFHPQRPVEWLQAEVGSRDSSPIEGGALEVEVARPRPTMWLFTGTPTGQRPDDTFGGMLEQFQLCLATSSVRPPWTTVGLAVTVDSPLGNGRVRADLEIIDASQVHRQTFYGADGDGKWSTDRLLDEHATPEQAVKTTLREHWPSVDVQALREINAPRWHREHGARVFTVHTGAENPGCVELLATNPHGPDRWLVPSLGECGFANALADKHEQLQRLVDQHSEPSPPDAPEHPGP